MFEQNPSFRDSDRIQLNNSFYSSHVLTELLKSRKNNSFYSSHVLTELLKSGKEFKMKINTQSRNLELKNLNWKAHI
jgi:hypothetical protein